MVDDGTQNQGPSETPLLSSLSAALDILCLFSSSSPELSLSEIARRLGIGKSRVHRLLTTLQSRQFIEQDPQTSRYRPGINNLWVGWLYEMTNRVVQESRPILQQIARQTNMTAHAATLADGELIYLAREFPDSVPRWGTVRSVRTLPHATALGKMILACLTDDDIGVILDKTGLPPRTPHTITDRNEFLQKIGRIREDGYAVDNEEADLDRRCIAVPLRNINNQLLGALSISGQKRDLSDRQRIEGCISLLRSAAQELSVRLGPYVLPVRMVPPKESART